MKKIVLLLLCIFLLTSCSKKVEFKDTAVASTIKIDADDTTDSIAYKAAHVVPTPNQYEALKNEFIAFIHLGPNTFTRMEWGNGMEDPSIFDLQELDTDQWCEAMKAAGMKMVIITVKHHDGFCLWQSRYTKHGIMSSPFKNGKGDILKELSVSAQKFGLKLGVYLSPADLYQIEHKEGLYGNLSKASERTIPRPIEDRPFANKTTFEFEVDDYNEYVLNQLFELLTEYGPIHEVWFDGAHPKRKGGQTYNYIAWKELIRTLAPEAVIFGREDIRWCGNEAGGTRDTEWNVIPYQDDPNEMNRFADITGKDIASIEKLQDATYLHYQQAETNTSIRAGWFYRDDTNQEVRSADDVFDIYERSVGGNSTFLLNIPPNRQGKFSDRDVAALVETGKRIRDTYGTDLFSNAEGRKEVLDSNDQSFVWMEGLEPTLEFTTANPIKINRFVLQENISQHGERISAHALDAWINGGWKEVARATNVGYKRILRFPEVTSTKFQLRILSARFTPTISKVSAHYYRTRPPQLSLSRTVDGMVSIAPKEHDFGWKPHGENATENINSGIQLVYTLDGSEPTAESKLYDAPFSMSTGKVKAMAIANGQLGTVVSEEFGMIKKKWKILAADSDSKNYEPSMSIDANSKTYWRSNSNDSQHQIAIDLGNELTVTGFSYTPPEDFKKGMIEKGILQISTNGKSWKPIEEFTFGNLINDPTPRKHIFSTPVKTRYIRLLAKVIAGNHKSAAIAELDFFED